MEKHGEVRDVYIPLDYNTKRPRGFAFVEFYDARDASAAREALDGFEMDGRDISVVFAMDRRKTPQEMRRIMPGGGRRDDSRDRDRRRSRDRGRGYDDRGRDYDRAYDRDRGRDRGYDRGYDRPRDRDRGYDDRGRGRDDERDRDRGSYESRR